MIINQTVNNHEDLLKVVDGLLEEVGLDRKELGGKVTFAGMDPIRPTVLKVGAAGAAVGAANAIASALIWKARSGESQDIHVDLRKAYTIQSPWQDILANYTLVNGVSMMYPETMALGIVLAPTADNRWVLLAPAYPAIQQRMCGLLDCGILPDQIKQATRKWNAEDLEKAGQDAAVPICVVRTPEEYQATEQYKHHAGTPLINIEKIGDSKPEPFSVAERPLSGVRALSMVHVVAGPAVGRQLAAQGADCLNLNTPGWLEENFIYFQSDAGLRQAYLDAREEKNRNRVYELVKDADVFVENLRPGLAGKQGFSAEELMTYRPGIIYTSLKFNAPTGPWADWMGFDFNAGALTGLFTETGTPDQPGFPHAVNVVVDFLAGYLATLGTQAALLRRATEGGSYKVTVSLTQATMFEMRLGLVDKKMLLDLESLGEEHQPLKPNLVTGQTGYGEFTRLGSQVEMSKTPEFWADPIINPIGSSKAEWLPRT